jgi:hypothetical protein
MDQQSDISTLQEEEQLEKGDSVTINTNITNNNKMNKTYAKHHF